MFCDALKSMSKGWDFMAIGSFGNSMGVLTSWSDSINLINTFSISSGLFTEVESRNLGKVFCILNIYG